MTIFLHHYAALWKQWVTIYKHNKRHRTHNNLWSYIRLTILKELLLKSWVGLLTFMELIKGFSETRQKMQPPYNENTAQIPLSLSLSPHERAPFGHEETLMHSHCVLLLLCFSDNYYMMGDAQVPQDLDHFQLIQLCDNECLYRCSATFCQGRRLCGKRTGTRTETGWINSD